MADPSLPITVLIEELNDENLEMQLNSIARLSTIALALGAERTRAELLPYLAGLEEQDEVMLAVAGELAEFVPFVGGPAHAAAIFAPLEKLAQQDETVVRDKAVEAICKVAAQAPAGVLEKAFVPMVKRLVAGDGWTHRASAAGMFAVVFGKLSAPLQTEMRKLFATLCADGTPMVKRAAAVQLGALAEADSPAQVKAELVPLYTRLAGDENDTVCVLAVGVSTSISKAMTEEERIAVVLPAIISASKHRSWRVRHAVAQKWSELQASMPSRRADMVTVLVRLLRDGEAEVKSQAAAQIPSVGEGLNSGDRAILITTNIVSHVSELCMDANQYVRGAVAGVISELAPLLGKEKAMDHLVPLVSRMLKDDCSDVRLNVIAHLEALQKVVGAADMSRTILPDIVALAEDPQWRVRLALIEQLPALAKSIGQDQFDSVLTPLTMTWLTDHVYAVRECTTAQLKNLVEQLGVGWAKKALVPKIVEMGKDSAYLARLTTLFTVSSLASVIDKDTAKSAFLPVVLHLAKDAVPNVRFNAARSLEQLVPKLDKSAIKNDVKPALEALKGDADADVMYYSQRALAVC